MVQASDEQSRKANDEAREDIEKDYPGLYWCHIRKDYFKWKPFIEYYKYNKL